MEKFWLKHYPAQVAHEIDPTAYETVDRMFREAVDRFRDQPAFTNMGVSLSFRDLDRQSAAFASYLQNQLKLKPGDRLAVQMPNLLQYAVVLYGAIRAGVIVVNTNPLYTPREMLHQFKDSGAVAIVILANFASKLEEILGQTSIRHVIVSEVGDALPPPRRLITNLVVRYVKKMVPAYGLRHVTYRAALGEGTRAPFRPVALKAEDTIFLQYTGGTTGVSKAAVLTHRNIVANSLQIKQWLSPGLREGKERVLAVLPMYHVYTLTVNCVGFFNAGLTNVLVTNPRDIPALAREIAREKPTVICGVNTLFGALLQNAEFRAIDFRGLKVSVAGAMALKTAVAAEWHKVTGTPILEGYGLTEASPVVSCNPVGGGERIGTIGMPVPSTEIRIVGDDGQERGVGQVGELCVRGPQVMQGYWNQTAESATAFWPGGWLRTGDMASISADGFLKIEDRKKDMILVSGFNVYPNEIEEVAMRHPKVADVAAVGVPSEHSGEAVKLFVVKRDPSLTADELKEFLAKDLTGYKRPKTIEFLAELPKNNVGKVLRRKLREPAE